MRTLLDDLLQSQKKKSLRPACRIVLTHGETTYTIEENRIRKLVHIEEPWRVNAKGVILDNSDGYFTELAIQGFQAVISWGLHTSEGAKYSETSPMRVTWQQLDSSPGALSCELNILGIPDLMDEDEASEAYTPDEDDTKTVKTLLTQIAGATLSCFSHCQAYAIVYDSEDSLISSYKPKDSFAISIRGSRLAAFKRVLDYCGCVARVEADGKWHIFVPQTTGTPVYEYSLSSGHTFFSKAYRKSLVLPNRVDVKSREHDDPQYSGYAVDSESYALLPKRQYFQCALESNAEATSIAGAILGRYQLNAEQGSASIPINCGSELYDYVKITDARESDYRVGNIGYIKRTFQPEKKIWEMVFGFGDPPTVRNTKDLYKALQRESGGFYQKDAYIENLWIDQINAIWLDPEGNIDPSKLTDFLDNIPDGEYNATVKTMHLDASGLYFDSATIYTVRLPGSKIAKLWKSTTPQTSPDEGDFWIDTNYTPNRVKRWSGSTWQELPADDLADLEKGIFIREVKSSALTAEGLVFLDKLDDSGNYKRTKSSALTAAGLVLLDETVEGTHGLVLKTDITAGHVKGSAIVQSSDYRLVDDGQIDDWDEGYEVALEAYDLGQELEDDLYYGYLTLSSYTNISGTWYKEGGIKINASSGIVIYGNEKALVTRASEYGTDQCYVGSDGKIYAGAGAVYLASDGLHIKGEYCYFKTSGGSTRGLIKGLTSDFFIHSMSGYNLYLSGGATGGNPVIIDASNIDLTGGGYLDLPQRSSHPTGVNGRLYHNTAEHRNYQYVEGGWDIV